MTNPHDYRNSVMREKLCLHIFLSNIYKLCWKNDAYKDIQILFPEIDSSGADLVIVHKGITCFIQLKSINKNAETSKVTVNKTLFEQSSHCVLLFTFDEENVDIVNYKIFKSNKEIPHKFAKHTKANAEGIKNIRPNITEHSIRKFTDISKERLIDKIFENEYI